jgi:uncharacterized protein YigA (DUF484 family)
MFPEPGNLLQATREMAKGNERLFQSLIELQEGLIGSASCYKEV